MADAVVKDTEQNQNQEPDQAQLEAQARRGGWRPQEEYRGAAPWVDAKTFVQRGQEVLPHIQRENRQLQQQLAQEKAEREKLAADLAASQQQIAGLTTFQQELAGRERERIRNELAAELKAAREAGDTVAEARILGQLSAPPPAQKPPPVQQNQQPTQRATVPQEMTDWVAENDWYTQDKVLAQAMNTVGADLRAQGKLAGLSLTEQLNETAKVVLERYAPPRRNGGQNRSEGGGRPSGPQGGGQPSADSFEAMSAQAKAECDAQGERLGLIGKGKAFADLAAWRKHYAFELSRYAPGVGYDYHPPGN
jgi:hypothetical protein